METGFMLSLQFNNSNRSYFLEVISTTVSISFSQRILGGKDAA